MTQQQVVLPFNTYTGQRLTVHLTGPRTAPQFVAAGGLLHAYHPHRDITLSAHDFLMPPEDVWDTGDTPPTPGISYEEEVAAYVEHAAQVLFDLIQDTAELERVAARLRHHARPGSNRLAAVEALHDEQAAVNTFFGEVLERYCIQLGPDAAEALAHWLAEVAEQLNTPGSPGTPGSNLLAREPLATQHREAGPA